jgi:hypothetical protein
MNQRRGAKRILRRIEELERELREPAPFEYQRRAAIARESHQLLHDALDFRGLPGKPDGLAEVRARTLELAYEAIEKAYPHGFWEDYERLRAGDAAFVEAGIRFLEADPWFFRSGYIKENLTRWLKRLPLTPDQEERLRGAVLNIVDHPDGRREVRYYGRLAARVANPALVSALEERASSGNPATVSCARLILATIRQRTPKLW